MWTVKNRYSSVANLHRNPQLNNKNPQSINKHRKEVQRQIPSYKQKQMILNDKLLTDKQSPTLPKLLKINQNQNNQNKKTFNDTISNFSDKRTQKNQAKQLTLAISVYQLHREQYYKSPYYQFSFDIMQVMRQFSLVQNNFKQLFKNMYEDIKQFIYLTSNIQFATKYQVNEGQLYKKICQDIDKKINKRVRQYQQKIKQVTIQKQEIQLDKQNQAKYFAQRQKKFLQQIQWLKKISNNQYVRYLQAKIEQNGQRIEELYTSELSLIRLRDELQKQIIVKTDTIVNQLKQIGRLNTLIHDLRIGKQQSQKLILRLKDRFDQFNLKMVGIKEVIQDVQKENQELKTQRTFLNKRASVSFQQLTPRPKYKKVLNFSVDQQKLKLKSTQQVMMIIMQKIGVDAYKKQFRDEIFDRKLSSFQMHPKLAQVQQIRFNTQTQILSSKQELNSVSRLFYQDI